MRTLACPEAQLTTSLQAAKAVSKTSVLPVALDQDSAAAVAAVYGLVLLGACSTTP